MSGMDEEQQEIFVSTRVLNYSKQNEQLSEQIISRLADRIRIVLGEEDSQLGEKTKGGNIKERDVVDTYEAQLLAIITRIKSGQQSAVLQQPQPKQLDRQQPTAQQAVQQQAVQQPVAQQPLHNHAPVRQPGEVKRPSPLHWVQNAGQEEKVYTTPRRVVADITRERFAPEALKHK